MEEGEWTQVNRRNKGGFEARQQEATKATTTFLFTNFPEDWSLANMRREFEGFGNLVDIYVARKKTRAGKCFGFLHYAEGRNPDSFERLLNGIPVCPFKVKVNITRVFRNKPAMERRVPFGAFHRVPPGAFSSRKEGTSFQGKSSSRNGYKVAYEKSFADVLK